MAKAAVAGISVIIVVGVVIGAVIGISRIGQPNDDTGSEGNGSLSPKMKFVNSLCDSTSYKDNCLNSLSPVANNASAEPNDYLRAAIKATTIEVKKALEMSGVIGMATTSSYDRMSIEDCQDLLQFAVDELDASFSMVGNPEMHPVDDRVAELKNWLSAVVSYQETCLDGIENPELKTAMNNGLLNATQLTSNALAIVSEVAKILKALDVHLDGTKTNRRLLNVNGYPTWFSSADRKLLASQDNGRLTPNAVVAKDGSGQFKTIAAALAAYPKKNNGRYVIYVKAGVYEEYITVTKEQVNVFMYGDGPTKTIITGRKNNRQGVPTFQTASFTAIGKGFIAKSIGFQNTAGPEGHQAVALRVQSDMSAFFNCRMDGYQDTLYVQTHRQFYRNCVITGTIDFIFGDSSTVIQNSLIIVRKPMDNQQNTVTAHGRKDKGERTGLVIQNCRIVPEEKLFPQRFKIRSYLGRPWKEYSRTVIMESTIGDLIQPEGWMPWSGDFALDTLFYAEYGNRGPGAATGKRVNWKGFKVITNKREALQFTAGPFLEGDKWLPGTTTPFDLGLTQN
ncbi:PREDICTED: pectinesterase-like [Nelumbo nucifera]|uniref:Pectinesterase n=2 Tax=Nelumbo nucifera TaxID=4432 RepID=A0A822Z0E1_NELNU|nr:PREDICTED: pectinesterase-like [Nelumbo nucifera]DAD38442.1 TPA_asm: hypothetical protein HUJ06_009083 [Nelumbo nucifera]